jgi:hypothetical protein
MKAKKINIRNYCSNIEVFAEFGRGRDEDNPNEEDGRILSITTDSDHFPRRSSVYTLAEIVEKCGGLVTYNQAKEIKEAILTNCENRWD